MLEKLNLHRLKRLTEREKDVYVLISKGLTNRVSAELLGISRRTVEIHRANIMHKYNARNLVHLNNILARMEETAVLNTEDSD